MTPHAWTVQVTEQTFLVGSSPLDDSSPAHRRLECGVLSAALSARIQDTAPAPAHAKRVLLCKPKKRLPVSLQGQRTTDVSVSKSPEHIELPPSSICTCNEGKGIYSLPVDLASHPSSTGQKPRPRTCLPRPRRNALLTVPHSWALCSKVHLAPIQRPLPRHLGILSSKHIPHCAKVPDFSSQTPTASERGFTDSTTGLRRYEHAAGLPSNGRIQQSGHSFSVVVALQPI